MRDLRKLRQEIEILEQKYGQKNIGWHKDFEWIGIDGWRLPANINQRHTRIIVVLPQHYGNGAPIVDSFIQPNLMALDRYGNYADIGHYFKTYRHNEAGLTFGNTGFWSQKGYWWLCLQDLPGDQRYTESIRQYLNHVFVFLSEPFRDWNGTFRSYRQYSD